MNTQSLYNHLPHFINGEFVIGEKTFDNISPVDGKIIAKISEADIQTVDRAVTAARQALNGEWSRLTTNERSALLCKVADGIEKRFDDFVAAEVADTGRSVEQARTLDVPRGAANFRTFAELIKNDPQESYTTELADGTKALNYTVRKPAGVVAVVAPWNLPLLLLTWKLAPALACGNTIVAKPSEETPSSATLLAEVMHDAGMPPGVFNLVHGFGPHSAGEFLVKHKDIDIITFTGESKTGSEIMRSAADGVKPVSFELGGKNAAVVFADADFEKAVEGVARSTFTNCGQVCLCSERVYVERSIFDKFVAALKEKAEALQIGAPRDKINMGPLISNAHREKVLAYFALAEQDGAHVVTGGSVPVFNNDLDNGAFIQPTIWTNLQENARCVKEEIFGPVCHVAPFDTEEELVSKVNDSEYGLAAALWTSDLQRAHRISLQIEAGIVWVNCWFLRDLRTPFGGVKSSGIGREGGKHSLAFYSEVSNICVAI